MCDFGGPSNEEKSLEAANAGLAGSLTANYQTLFGEQQGTMQQLSSEINQIRSGTTGPGFGAAELAARTSQIQNNAAATARNAQQVTENASAGQVFGGASDSNGLNKAIREQVTGQIATGAQINEGNELNNLTAANYAQGRANAQATESGLATLAGFQNPVPYAQGAGTVGANAFNEAHTINQEEIERSQAIAGLIGKGIGMVTGGLTGGLANLDTEGTSSPGEQFMNFFNGATGIGDSGNG